MSNIKALIDKLNGKIFTVEFIKKDGTKRVMNCRTNVQKDLAGGNLRYDAESMGYLPVYDLQNKGYRMINLNTITSIKANGLEYLIVDR